MRTPDPARRTTRPAPAPPPGPRRRLRTAAALTTALGSLAVSALAAAPAEGRAPGPAGEYGVAVAVRWATEAGIAFGPCPAAEELPAPVECGTVQVPLDYAAPDGRRISLTVSRVRAGGAPGDRQGALVFNPGGPGGSSMYFPLAAGLAAWKRLAAAYDFVGYAPRGVGRSAPISCQEPARTVEAPTPAVVRPSEAEKRERIERARAYARGCAERTGPALRHYTSLNNARDLEVLRAALGEPELTYLGASYGTYFGALYATLFPSRVRRMVFDSAVDPDPERIWYVNNLNQSLAFEQRWLDFKIWAARHDDTYRLGVSPGAVQASYEKAAARLAEEPAGGTVGPGELQAAMLSTGYHDRYWPRRAGALAEYLAGDPAKLIEQAAPDPSTAKEAENSTAVYTAVECNDAPWPEDWATWDRDNSRLAGAAPFETWSNAWLNLPCAYWPAPRQRPLEVRTGPGELPPVLILASERDAATPYEGAKELQRRLAGSVLVTERDAGNHGVSGGQNDCVDTYLEDYLLRGVTPVRRATCAPHPEPDPVSLDRRTVPGPEVPAGRTPAV
ncbi:alpha/beta hydrolase [Streptomyces sp. LP05-1]|uniref:Alpha/beta hydrolase n=1 Tax=Streptomyces pyxinae TaxID=2970734 RepID=A0ABT2CDK2_9ACTN|nr:alpha/beta hydrolase [Streptomyces sp. LP05-1]MCS0635495.1 alpha/beta hydrolase [Streptomyces sp. LP05-1]